MLHNQQYKQKNNRSREKKNWPLSLRSTEESIVNQNSYIEYWVFCILQTFVKKEKIDSNEIWALFLLLNFPKSRKIVFKRGCALNN